MGGARILVVDDDTDIRETMAMVLAEEGHAVTTARDGHDALQQLQHDPLPDVVVLDMMMPVMDGETFVSIVRGDPRLARLRIVVMSGHMEVRDKLRRLRVDAVIMKPPDVADLLRTVEAALPTRAGGSSHAPGG